MDENVSEIPFELSKQFVSRVHFNELNQIENVSFFFCVCAKNMVFPLVNRRKAFSSHIPLLTRTAFANANKLNLFKRKRLALSIVSVTGSV